MLLALLFSWALAEAEEAREYEGGRAFRAWLPRERGAACLDGSQAGMYVRRGAQVGKYVVSLQGGGECVTQEECEQRATTKLGSSKTWPQEMTLWRAQSGDKRVNPDMFDWNQIFVPYCSGDLFLGTNGTSGNRGALIVEEVVRTAAALYGLADADTIVLTGESAGGIGALALADFVAGIVREVTTRPSPTDFKVLSIGGFYFPNDAPDPAAKPGSYIPWGAEAWPKYFAFWGVNARVLAPRCVAAAPDEPWRCALGALAFPYYGNPVFLAEALTDRVVMALHDGFQGGDPRTWDAAARAYAESWQRFMLHALAAPLASSAGVFAPACFLHTEFERSQPRLGDPPRSMLVSFGNWAFRGAVDTHLVDACGVACNPTCPPRAESRVV